MRQRKRKYLIQLYRRLIPTAVRVEQVRRAELPARLSIWKKQLLIGEGRTPLSPADLDMAYQEMAARVISHAQYSKT